MILANFGIQDGEREYIDWSYYANFSFKDYQEGKITDLEMLNEAFCINAEEQEPMSNGKYWDDTRLIWVKDVKAITPEELTILQNFIG